MGRLDLSPGTEHRGTFRLGTSTTAGWLLTADASGFGTWQAPARPYKLAADFAFAAQAPGGSLTAATPATVTLTPVPLGVNGADVGHYLYVSAGTGTPEAVLITGGTAVEGGSSGTVTFTPANNHTGAWTIQSATAGMQEAVNNLETAGQGGKVITSAGVIQVYGPTRIVKRVSVTGMGRETTVINNNHTTLGVFSLVLANTTGAWRDNTIRDLTICAGGQDSVAAESSTGTAVYIENGNGGTVLDTLAIRNHRKGIELKNSWDTMIRNTIIWYFGYYGMHIWNTTDGDGGSCILSQLFISNNSATGSQLSTGGGILWENGGGLYASNIEITSTKYGVIIRPAASRAANYGFFTSVAPDTCDQDAWLLDATAAGSSINSIHMDGCWASYSTNGAGLKTVAGTIRNVFWNGGRLRENGTHGAHIVVGTNIHIHDAEIDGNSKLTSTTYSGVYIAANISDWSIQGCRVGAIIGSGVQKYGIEVAAGTGNNYTIVDNDLRTNTTSAMLNDATGSTRYIDRNLGYDYRVGVTGEKMGVGITGLPTHTIHAGSTIRSDGAEAFNTYYAGQFYAAWIAYRSRGTLASPTATQSDDELLVIGARGYGDNAYASSSRAMLKFIAAQTWTNANQGTQIRFYTTPLNSATEAWVWAIQPNGDLLPITDNGQDFGSGSLRLRDGYFGRNLSVGGTATIIGETDITPTWNNVGTTFTALNVTATDTTSAAGSLLLSLSIAGVGTKFSVSKDGSATFADGASIWVGSTSGTKIGTATTQKLAFFNSTPIVQPSSTTDLRTALINLGLYATGGASPLNLNGGLLTAGSLTVNGTYTNPTAVITFNPTINITLTDKGFISQGGIFNVTSAVTNVYGIVNLNQITGTEGQTAPTVTIFYNNYARLDTLSGYDANITAAILYGAITPSHAGGGTISDYYGYYVDYPASATRITRFWSFYGGGAAPAHFGGAVDISGSLTQLSGNPGGQNSSFNIPVYKVLTGDVSLTGTTVQNTTGMSFTIGASETWAFEFFLRIGKASGTAGLKLAISVPASATLDAMLLANTTGATAFVTERINASATLNATALWVLASSLGMARITGIVVNSTNAGTVQLQQAAVTSQNSIVAAGSIMNARRIA